MLVPGLLSALCPRWKVLLQEGPIGFTIAAVEGLLPSRTLASRRRFWQLNLYGTGRRAIQQQDNYE